MIKINLNKKRQENFKIIKEAIRKGITTEEHELKKDHNYKNLFKIRGYILGRTIEVEMMLNNFLSSYFIYDQFESEQKWNFRFILNKLSFNSKICIFSKIKFHLKKKFRKRYEGLDKCLDEIRKTRNLVAHAIQAHFTEPILKTEKREINITKDYLQKFNDNTDIAMISLSELIWKIIKERPQRNPFV